PTSLQLALEDKDVAAKLAKYEAALAKLLDGRENVIGFAFAINAKVEGADVYGSAALFRKLWPQRFRTAAADPLPHSSTTPASAAPGRFRTAGLPDGGRWGRPTRVGRASAAAGRRHRVAKGR